MRIYIARHGHKANLLDGYDGGWNTPLSDIGRQQAEHLAQFLAGEEIDYLYSSPQLRAIQTAGPLHQRLAGDWHVWPVFCETTPRPWEVRLGEGKAEATTAWPGSAQLEEVTAESAASMHGNYYLLSSLKDRYPGIKLTQPFPWPDAWWLGLRDQTKESGYARVELGARALLHRHQHGDRIAVICHGNCGDMLATVLMDFPRGKGRRFGFGNTGVTRVDINEEGSSWLVYVNRIQHLPPALRI